MKSVAHLAYAAAFFLFGAVGVSTARTPLLHAQSTDCDTYGTGEKCGERTTCLEYETTSVEMVGMTKTCKTQETVYLYKVEPTSGGGSGGGGGAGFGDPADGDTGDDPCGDPDLWSDDTANCDTSTQQAT